MQAAIKAVPLGQSSGQRILARLAAGIPAATDHALSAEPQAFSPMLAILSARHETCWPLPIVFDRRALYLYPASPSHQSCRHCG